MFFLSKGGVFAAVLSSLAFASATSPLYHDGTPLRRLVRSESGAGSEKRNRKLHVQGVLNVEGVIEQRHQDDSKADPRHGADDDVKRDGVCLGTGGILTRKTSDVKVVADLSDCGAGVKELVADLSNDSSPLSTCAQKVEDDADCANAFQMEDESFKCSCMKGAAHCPKRGSNTTCIYTLVPPVCSNTTGIVLHSNNSLFRVQAVYPNQFGAGCTNTTTLGAHFSGGLKACADLVASNPECGATFQMHRQTSNCTCLKPNATCAYEDSTEICQYEVVSHFVSEKITNASST